MPVHSVITANISKYYLQFYYKKCEYNQHFEQNGDSIILFFLPTVFEGCICQPIFCQPFFGWEQKGNELNIVILEVNLYWVVQHSAEIFQANCW